MNLDAVNTDTRLVTMTISGNGENVFVNSFFGCAAVDAGHLEGNWCQRKYGTTFTDLITTQTYPHLVDALSAVRAKAPHATIVILGYPQIPAPVGDPACFPALPYSMGDTPAGRHRDHPEQSGCLPRPFPTLLCRRSDTDGSPRASDPARLYHRGRGQHSAAPSG